MRMAHHLITEFNNAEKQSDFGCAKGFLVKALRLLNVEAYGDVSLGD